MGKTIVSIHEFITLNHLLEEKELLFKIHFHDACGAQSFSVEAIKEDATTDDYDRVKGEIISYFEAKGITVTFAQNNRDFYVI